MTAATRNHENAATRPTTDERELVITRVLNAPRELVWRAWTEPAHLAQWFGPKGFTTKVPEQDLRPGGHWRYIMVGPDGAEYPSKGVFREVVPYERIVTTDEFELDAEYPVASSELPSGLVVTCLFEDLGGKTRLTIRIMHATVEDRRKHEAMGVLAGWNSSLDCLEEELAAMAVEPALVITRDFAAPRDLVFKAFTEAERLAQWWGPKGFGMAVAKLELRPGGLFHYSMRPPNGTEMWGRFVYREIVPPERLVFISSFADEQGNPTPNPFTPGWPLEVLNIVTFAEHDGQTTVVLQGGPLNATAAERQLFADSTKSMQQGFDGTFEQLDAYLVAA